VKPGCPWHKPPVEVHHSQEILQLLDVGRGGVFCDGLHPPGERLDAAGGDAVSQEIQLGFPELTLLRVGRQARFLESLED
jgi:hypothetical protein